jgi:hypothetical protein
VQAYAKLPDMPAEDDNDSEANSDFFRHVLGALKEFARQWFRRSGLRRKLALAVSWLVLIVISFVSGKRVYNDWAQSRHQIAVTDEAEDDNDSEANSDFFRRVRGKLKEFARQWFRPQGIRRKIALGVSWLILLGLGCKSFRWVYDDWAQHRHQIAVIDRFPVATLAIAFFAAVFALLAYQVSTGAPNLQLGIMLHKQKNPYNYKLKYKTGCERWRRLECWFDSSAPPSKDPEYLRDLQWWTHVAYMWVENKSRYPAKSPAVKVRFGEENDESPMGLCRMPLQTENPDGPWRDKGVGLVWKDTSFKTQGIVVTATQWDGGSTYPIHGKSSRRLPDLPLETLYSRETVTNKLQVELLAEGYRKVVKVHIEFIIK